MPDENKRFNFEIQVSEIMKLIKQENKTITSFIFQFIPGENPSLVCAAVEGDKIDLNSSTVLLKRIGSNG